MHAQDCSYRIGLACTCGAGDVDSPLSEDARFMQALLTGWVAQAIYGLTDPEKSPLTQPVKIEHIGPEGLIQVRLASGLLATVVVHVE